jgi:hypothetical protein
VRIAKADLVPADTNLLEAYHSFGDLEAACREAGLTVGQQWPLRTRASTPLLRESKPIVAVSPESG